MRDLASKSLERDTVNTDIAMDLYTLVQGSGDPKAGIPRAPAAVARASEYLNLCFVTMSVLGELSALDFEPFVPFLPPILAFAILHLPNPMNSGAVRGLRGKKRGQCE